MHKRLITETDVRALSPGSTLAAGRDVVITPAAFDLARARGIAVRLEGDASPPAVPAPGAAPPGRATGVTVVLPPGVGRTFLVRLTETGPRIEEVTGAPEGRPK